MVEHDLGPVEDFRILLMPGLMEEPDVILLVKRCQPPQPRKTLALHIDVEIAGKGDVVRPLLAGNQVKEIWRKGKQRPVIDIGKTQVAQHGDTCLVGKYVIEFCECVRQVVHAAVAGKA